MTNTGNLPNVRGLLAVLGTDAERTAPAEESPNTTDQEITCAHLLDALLHHLGHTLQHLDRLDDPKVKASKEATSFNVEHAAHHLREAQDHGVRLRRHMMEHPSDPAVFAAQTEDLAKHKSESTVGG